MLTASDTPTRLLDPQQRRAVPIAAPTRPSRYRWLWVLARFAAFLAAVVGLAIRRRLTMEAYADRLRRTFEDIGGLWIKVGQLLSLRIDVFPQPVCRELSRIQEEAVGFPSQIARAIVESELGVPIERCFSEFADVPFAAVPMGQVHRARLRMEDAWVAVKVQAPHWEELFARDLVLIRRLARLLMLLRFRLHMRWTESVAELEEMMRQDLDFHFEASSMRRMRRSLRRHGVRVPRVFSRYCARRVLVSEFIHAVLMSDYLRVQAAAPDRLHAWLRENGIDARRVARRLMRSMFRQILEDNLYHGDMRPENIVLLRNGRVAFIDFRAVNFTEREYLDKYRLFIRALATRDYAKAADLAFMLCAVLPVIDIEQAKERVIRALRSWATRTLVADLGYHERSIDHATAEVVRVLVRYKCTMEYSWLRIHRAMSTLDESLACLNPKLNHTKQALRYFDEANRRSLAAFVGSGATERALSSVRTSIEIQDRVDEYTMFQSALIRRHAQVFQGATNKFADTFAALVGVIAVVGLLPAVLVVLRGIDAVRPEIVLALVGGRIAAWIADIPPLGAAASAIVVLADVWVFASLQRLKHRLRQKDVRAHERVAAF
jgi:ubiquinone biosynthesis protein